MRRATCQKEGAVRYVLLTAAALLAVYSWWHGPGGQKFRLSWQTESDRHAAAYAGY
jgi:hypothetical protein